MNARSCRTMFRRVFGEMMEVPTKAQRGLSGSSIGRIVIPKESPMIRSRGEDGFWGSRAADVMVRRAEGLGGLREFGATQRPSARAPSSQADSSPEKMKEREQDEFLLQASNRQAKKIMEQEQELGLMPGESMLRSDAESVSAMGGTTETDAQKELAEEFTKKSESERDDCIDQHAMHNLEVDEDVKRGLVADSEQPVGRVHKAKDIEIPEDWDEEERGRIRLDVSEHGSFKAI